MGEAQRQINPPCERCGTETLIYSDHSGGWNGCPTCGWLQNIRHTPGGTSGFLTGMDTNITHGEWQGGDEGHRD